MSLTDLQQAIDRSLANASEFTRSLFAGNSWDAAQVQSFVNEIGNLTVETVNRSSKPHAAPTIAGCADGQIYFSASPGSTLLRNLKHAPAVAFTVSGLGHSVFGQAVAVLAGPAPELQSLVPALGPDSKLSRLILEPWEGYIYSLQISRIFAN